MVVDCILLLMGHESPTFKRIVNKQALEAKTFIIRRPICVSHLSPSILKEILQSFLVLSQSIQSTNYFINGLKKELKIGTVLEALLFKCGQILDRFTSELSDLQIIAIYQAGQVSKQQLDLQNPKKFEPLLNNQRPLTLLCLEDIVRSDLLVKV